jgi:hypothetical protein
MQTKYFAPVVLLALTAPHLSAQVQAVERPTEVLEVVDLVFTPDTSWVTFRVVNRSPKPVLAYNLKVTTVFADGTTKSGDFSEDLVSSIPLVGLIIAPSDYHAGELKMGQRSNEWRIQPPSSPGKRAVAVTVVPDVVIFIDNTVIGENDKVADATFRRRQEIRDEYGRQLQLLRTFETSKEIEAHLNDLARRLKAPGETKNYFVYYDIQNTLRSTLKQCIAPKKHLPRQCLSQNIELAESTYAAYAAHAERAGGVK